MVAMTALGSAAAVLDRTITHVKQRICAKEIATPRDTCFEAVGKHFVGINAAMLVTLCAIAQNLGDDSRASLWSRAVKAWSVEQSYEAVSELALLMGASAVRPDHFASKALPDLRAFLLADGIHDSLRRSAGRALLDLP